MSTPILAWGRPLDYQTRFHAIIDLGDSVVTACNGRWSRSENQVIVRVSQNDPAATSPACRACLDYAFACLRQRLAEISPDEAFDFSDEIGGEA